MELTMTAPTVVRPAPPVGGVVAPMGASRQARTYYDEHGKLHTAAHPVPVDQFGVITGAQFRCRRCRIDEWFPLSQVPKGKAPTCGSCERRMDPLPVRDAP